MTPSKKQLAEGSGATRKGRIPKAEGPPKGSKSSKAARGAVRSTGSPTKAAGKAGTGKGSETAPAAGDDEGAAETPEVVDTGRGRPAKPVHEDGRRYGGGAVAIVFVASQALALIVSQVVLSATNYDPNAVAGVGGSVGSAVAQYTAGQSVVIPPPVPIWLSLLLQLPLWGVLVAGPCWFAAKRGRGIVQDLALRMKPVDAPLGLVLGAASQLLLIPAVYWLVNLAIGQRDVSETARALTDRASDPFSVLLVFVLVGMGAPIAEEMYFRGMALPIFNRRISATWAVVASAAFFALTHGNLLLVPGLFLFAVLLGFLRVRTGRLGPAIWAHVGFNVVAAASLVWNIGFF